MAASMCANMATAASLLQRSSVRSTESTCSSFVNLSPWHPKSTQILGHGYSKNLEYRIAEERRKSDLAVRATVAYRDVDSVSVSVSVLLVVTQFVNWWRQFVLLVRHFWTALHILFKIWRLTPLHPPWTLQEPNTNSEQNSSTTELLCCPICFKPLSRTGPTGLTQ